jgi:calcineurin-like phosphoesterase family protein
MSNVYFVADLHLGHAKIAEHRDFDSVGHHDTAVLDSIRALPRGSHLHVLGDISEGFRWRLDSAGLRYNTEDQALFMLRMAALEAGIQLHLKSGNHDSCSGVHRESHKQFARFGQTFNSIATGFTEMRIDGHRVLVGHFPYNGDSGRRDEDRYPQHRPRDLGMPIIHGHTHADERVSRSKLGTLQLCVSWDVDRRPVSATELAATLKKEWR